MVQYGIHSCLNGPVLKNVDILATGGAVAAVMALHVAKTPHDTMELLYTLERGQEAGVGGGERFFMFGWGVFAANQFSAVGRVGGIDDD